MAGLSGKKRSPFLFLAGAFVAIAALTFVANRRSGLAYEVSFPLNDGVAYLYTRGDYLAAVCHDDKVYVWDWNNLSAKPRIVEVQSDQTVLLESGYVASVRRSGAYAMVVADLDGGREDKRIPIPAGDRRVYLGANRSGCAAAAVLAEAGREAKRGGQEVMLVDCNAGLVRPVVALREAAGDRVTSMAVSDDGYLVALTGERAGQGWVALVNVEQTHLVWDKQLPDLQKIHNAVFSTDGRVIYIRGTDSTVQILDSNTGNVLKRLLPFRENRSTARSQDVQVLATSNDGRFMAANVSNTVCIWDCATDKVIFSKWPGHKLVSGLAFSPDSKFLATSDSRQGGTIKIWRVPKR